MEGTIEKASIWVTGIRARTPTFDFIWRFVSVGSVDEGVVVNQLRLDTEADIARRAGSM